MSRRMHALLLALAAAWATACGQGICQPGETRACYNGPSRTRGVGLCHDGVQTCSEDGAWRDSCPGEQVPDTEICDTVDDDCDGQIDEDVKNVCGGCAVLEGAPGDLCAGCGRLACKGTEALRCVPPARNPGDACEKDGCPGRYVCSPEGEVSCLASRKNECGVCGGPAVAGLGDTCQNTAGCAGTLACNLVGTGTRCDGPDKNSCGACGLSDVPNLGGSCTGANGCPGGLVCSDTLDSAICDAQPRNACQKCNGPVVTGVGDACGAGACTGVLACNATQDGTFCDFPGRGDACTGADGCSGHVTCGPDGETTICDAPPRNACGLCGGATITGTIGDACAVGSCAGTLQCSASGAALACVPDASCVTNHVVISELTNQGPGGNANEFVELYNPTAADVSLSGWVLWYRSTGGNISKMATLAPEASIRSHGYFLLANTNYAGAVTPDATFTTDMASSRGTSVFLTTASAGATFSAAIVVDKLGYGPCDTTYAEGGHCAPAQTISAGSIERKALPTSTAASMAVNGADALAGNGSDTDDNGADFVATGARGPQSTASPTEP